MEEILFKLLKENKFYTVNNKPNEYICSKNSNIRAIVSKTCLFFGPYDPKAKTKAYSNMTKYDNIREIDKMLQNYI